MLEPYRFSKAAASAPFRFATRDSDQFFEPPGWREAEFRSTLDEAVRLRRSPPISGMVGRVCRSLVAGFSSETDCDCPQVFVGSRDLVYAPVYPLKRHKQVRVAAFLLQPVDSIGGVDGRGVHPS